MNLTTRDAALELLIELTGLRLDVALIPSQDPECAMRGGKIRAVQEANADWYREFCSRHPSSRRRRKKAPDTRIRREHTLAALERIIAGADKGTQYAARLQPFIAAKLTEMNAWQEQADRERGLK